jgi:hypothetical protein
MFPVQPPLAFLNHPWMLGWLAAAAAPIILHLLRKQKYREVPWAAMQYLLAAMRKNSRRIQIEQWLLLAVRTLLIVLLVMAVTEPGCEQAGVKFGSGDRAHKVLVVDGSFSMAYKPTDKSRFDRAKDLAARIVEESNQGDGFTLVLMGSPPRVVVGSPAFEKRDFRAEIDNLRLPQGGGDLTATLAAVEEVVKRARREQPRLAREDIFFLTDLGRTSWAPEGRSAAATAEFRARSEQLSKPPATLYVIDLGQAGSENAAITSLASVEPFATVARDVTLEAEVRNFGRQSRPHQLVELFVDGRRAGEEYVDLEPSAKATVAFPYRFDTPGDHAVELRLAPDLLAIDNHRWLSLPVKEQLRVLCVNGKPAGGAFRGATDYLVVALSPGSDANDRGMVRTDVVPESGLLEADLASYDCVFVADVAQFTSNEAGVLESYLKQGGGLVFFLGDQVQADSYNRRLSGNSSDGARVLPVTLGDKSPQGQYRFNPLGYEHPLVRAFRDQEQAGLLTTPVYRYFKLHVPENSQAKVALAFDDGDPAIVEEPIARGRSIVVATSADVSWTTMPVWPSYLPIVQELLAWAVRGQLSEHNMLVGQPLGDSLRRTPATSVSLRTPTGETSAVRVTPDRDGNHWSYGDTTQSGLYVASVPPPAARSETFAVNVDTTESDLTKLDPIELQERVWAGIPFIHRTDWQDLNEETSEAIVHRSSLHQILLFGVMALLLLDTFLAWAFGRRTV